MAEQKSGKGSEDWRLTEEEITTSTAELVAQVKNALKDVRDPIGGANIVLNVAMNLHALAMSAISKYTSLKGEPKDKMMKDLYRTYCDGHKQIMGKLEPELAKRLQLTVVDVPKLHLE